MKLFKFIVFFLIFLFLIVGYFLLKDIWILDEKHDVTKENNPWWHEKINFTKNIQAEEIKRDVVVAIVDTGVNENDFSYTNIIKGYNAIDGSFNTKDSHGHGKMLAHLIASPKIGVNPYAIILPVKVRKSMIDNPMVVSEGIKWAVDHGADIINLSLGREPTKNNVHQGYRKGVEYALKAGKILIASAGTSGEEVFYPGAIEGVFTVGGLDANLKYQSNINIENIDIFAVDTKKRVSTSFPTAIVSGAVSLIMALDENISSKEAMSIILEQAKVFDINGKNVKLLNLDSAIEYVTKKS